MGITHEYTTNDTRIHAANNMLVSTLVIGAFMAPLAQGSRRQRRPVSNHRLVSSQEGASGDGIELGGAVVPHPVPEVISAAEQRARDGFSFGGTAAAPTGGLLATAEEMAAWTYDPQAHNPFIGHVPVGQPAHWNTPQQQPAGGFSFGGTAPAPRTNNWTLSEQDWAELRQHFEDNPANPFLP